MAKILKANNILWSIPFLRPKPYRPTGIKCILHVKPKTDWWIGVRYVSTERTVYVAILCFVLELYYKYERPGPTKEQQEETQKIIEELVKDHVI
jgi:hypothetical protein